MNNSIEFLNNHKLSKGCEKFISRKFWIICVWCLWITAAQCTVAQNFTGTDPINDNLTVLLVVGHYLPSLWLHRGPNHDDSCKSIALKSEFLTILASEFNVVDNVGQASITLSKYSQTAFALKPSDCNTMVTLFGSLSWSQNHPLFALVPCWEENSPPLCHRSLAKFPKSTHNVAPCQMFMAIFSCFDALTL